MLCLDLSGCIERSEMNRRPGRGGRRGPSSESTRALSRCGGILRLVLACVLGMWAAGTFISFDEGWQVSKTMLPQLLHALICCDCFVLVHPLCGISRWQLRKRACYKGLLD